ncbi:MAG: hypothetical protein J5940_03630 [Clostridia bacterium]|nr:hypothetical protein [Clostridia bacterium]
MKQNAVKTFAILILISINLFLAISLSNQQKQIRYYDESLVNSTVENMKANGMIADASLIPRRRESFSILEGVYKDDAIYAAAKRFIPSGELTAYALPTGSLYFTDAEGSYARFYRNLYFEFCAADFSDVLVAIRSGASEPVAVADVLDSVTEEFFAVGGNQEEGGFTLSADNVMYYAEYDVYTVKCRQIADGLPVYGFAPEVYIKDGAVKAAEGKWCFSTPKSKINAETQDVISILINESGRLRTEYKAAQKDDPDALMPAYMVSGINANYYIFSDDDGNIYFVPVYVISYKDRSGSVYNTVNGKMISLTSEDTSGGEQTKD